MKLIGLGAGFLVLALLAFILAARLGSPAIALVGCFALLGLFGIRQWYFWGDSPKTLILMIIVFGVVVLLAFASQVTLGR